MVWSISNKLTGIGILAIAGIIAVVVPTFDVGSEVVDAVRTNDEFSQNIANITQVEMSLMNGWQAAMDAMVNTLDQGYSDEMAGELKQYAGELRNSTNLLSVTAHTPEEHKLVETIGKASNRLADLLGIELIDLLRSGQSQSLFAIDDKIDPLAASVKENLTILEHIIRGEAKEASENLLKTLSKTRSTIIGFAVIGALVLLVLLYLIIRSINVPLGAMTESMGQLAKRNLSVDIPGVGRADELGGMANALQVFKENMVTAERLAVEKEEENRRKEAESLRLMNTTNHLKEVVDAVAAGDLTQRAEVEGEQEDELVKLAENLNAMISNLGSITRKIHEVSDAMVTNMAEVRSAMASQSAAASEQAAAITETTSTLSEIKATSKQTLEKALSQGEKAEKARVESERGNQAVSKAVQGMGKINQKVEDVAASILDLSKKTQQIGEITEVVDDLARQSKMLALNASIEAAKAGESGQGFAVVAEEIRSLAEQSRESTAQVRAILQDIQSSSDHTVMVTEEGTKEVSAGSRLVDDSGKVIATLSDVVQQTALDSQQITAAVRQESIGVDQIVDAMNDIATSTRNTASSVRQTEVAIEDLTRLAAQLKERVRIYRV